MSRPDGEANDPGPSERHPLAPFAWYLVVAGGNALFYVLLCELLSRMGLAAPLAAALGLMPVLVVSYLGHKTKTFASRGAHIEEAPRFLVIAALDLAVAAGVPMAFAGMPSWMPFVALTVIIPVMNFFVMRLWVFRTKARNREA
jgi:putative flippase GtrA